MLQDTPITLRICNTSMYASCTEGSWRLGNKLLFNVDLLYF